MRGALRSAGPLISRACNRRHSPRFARPCSPELGGRAPSHSHLFFKTAPHDVVACVLLKPQVTSCFVQLAELLLSVHLVHEIMRPGLRAFPKPTFHIHAGPLPTPSLQNANAKFPHCTRCVSSVRYWNGTVRVNLLRTFRPMDGCADAQTTGFLSNVTLHHDSLRALQGHLAVPAPCTRAHRTIRVTLEPAKEQNKHGHRFLARARCGLAIRWPRGQVARAMNKTVIFDQPFVTTNHSWHTDFPTSFYTLAKVGNDTKCVPVRSCFLVIRLGPKTSECEKNVIVMSTVTGCEVSNCATTLHGFNKHASSRRHTEKNNKIYAGSVVSIVRVVHFSIRCACNSTCHSFPSCQLPGDLVSLSSVPRSKHRSQSVESLMSQCLRPDVARVHFCLDCGHRQQFLKCQILNEQESRVYVFHPCFVATSRAVLLSALACSRNGIPISSRIVCGTINSADSDPKACSSDSPLDKATVIRSSEDINQRNTECKMCSSSSPGHQPSQHHNIT